jgi:hypothetical protein
MLKHTCESRVGERRGEERKERRKKREEIRLYSMHEGGKWKWRTRLFTPFISYLPSNENLIFSGRVERRFYAEVAEASQSYSEYGI